MDTGIQALGLVEKERHSLGYTIKVRSEASEYAEKFLINISCFFLRHPAKFFLHIQ